MPTFAIPEDFGTEEGYRKKYTEKDLFDEFTQDENGNEMCIRDRSAYLTATGQRQSSVGVLEKQCLL